MAAPMTPSLWPSGAWGTLLLFTIPIGGGIPAGVMLAKTSGLGWHVMEALYLVSDVLLAFTFEPILKLLIRAGRRSPAFGRFTAVMKESIKRTTSGFGSAGPLALILIAFGIDPMTGRAATHMAGHGFVSGWALTIIGDMMYFTLIMVSTLWLNAAIGDTTTTIAVVMLGMMFLPSMIKKWREKSGRGAAATQA